VTFPKCKRTEDELASRNSSVPYFQIENFLSTLHAETNERETETNKFGIIYIYIYLFMYK